MIFHSSYILDCFNKVFFFCFQRNQLRFGHRGHRGHPHRSLHPASIRRGRHMLLPQQMRPSHVHRRQLLWQVRPLRQRQRYRGGKSSLHVSLSFLTLVAYMFCRLILSVRAIPSLSVLSALQEGLRQV